MPTKHETWCVLLGLTMGLAIGGSVCWAKDDLSTIVAFFETWQTLIAGAMALFGAYLTVVAIGRQIMQVETLAEQGRRREEVAAKAVLPLALSALNQYATRCIALLNQYLPYARSPIPIPLDLSVPNLPTEGIATLRTCARYAPPLVAHQIATVLGKLQVQHSRLEGVIEERRGEFLRQPDVLSAMKDAADVFAAINGLYGYGRDEDAVRKLAPVESLISAVRLSKLWNNEHPIYDYLRRAGRQDAGAP